jgi:Leucine-rich repeat (LRR) protein
MKKIALLLFSLIYLSVSLYAQREQDSLVLVKFYQATDGENWSDNGNWLSSEPISNWTGVTVIDNRVQELFIRGNNLNGTLPAEIGNLSALMKLSIIYNPLLSGVLPDEIGNLTELTELALHGNGLSGNIPTSIGNFTNLVELTLSENQFSGSIPTEVGNLILLENLELDDNKLSGAIPASLGNLTKLTRLSLSINDFSGALFPEMVNLIALERIFLFTNSFTALIDFSEFSNLRYIGVANNLLDFEDLEATNIDKDHVDITYDEQRTKLSISETLNGTEYTLDALYNFDGINYQWKKDDVSMENETNASLIVPETNIGVYNYSATHPNWLDLNLESESIFIGDLHGGLILSDSLALVDLYENTDGENWNSHIDYEGFSDNWLSTEPISQWEGVIISSGRVIALYLGENNLSGTLPASVGDLTALQMLNLSFNKLTGLIPIEVWNLTNLTELDLSRNTFSGNIPSAIENLTALEILYLNSNTFEGEIPSQINQLSNLTKLKLTDNQFSGSLPNISALSALTYVSISENELSGLSNLSALTNLTSLYVKANLFDFEAFEITQVDWTTDGFYYSPQNYQLPFSEQTNGSDISLSVNYDYAGTAYQWYKDKQILIDETSKTLTFASSDLGVYQCKANHNNLPELELKTEAYINGDLHGGVFLSDSLALVAFYNSTNGDNWTDNTNWLSSEPIEDWEEVEVENGRVNKLSLTDNNLTGTLPSEIGDLNYMYNLILWDNALTGDIPSEIGNLKNLDGLYLNNNQFSGSIPTTLGEMTSLTDVWLTNNKLSGTIPTEIGNISGLKRFYAEDNQLSGALPSSFGQLKEIYVLLLSGNKISGALPTEMANMTALKIFQIYNNELTDLTDLSGLPELFDCQVQNNLLDFESIDKAQIDWTGYYSKYDPQNLILPLNHTADYPNDILEVDYTYAGATYQWYKNDVLIDGETNQSITILMTDVGDYYCLVDYASLPDLTLQSETISITTVGIEEPGIFVSKVFPNPTRDYLKIQLEKPLDNKAFLELKNISGTTVLAQNIGNKTLVELQLKGISKGIYFLQINNGEDVFVQKIIVE